MVQNTDAEPVHTDKSWRGTVVDCQDFRGAVLEMQC